MGKQSIVVIGSSNTDMVVKTDHLPLPGETVLGGVFFMNPGGKGANQAVAASRLGGHVIFIAKVGNDLFGAEAIGLFSKEGIDTTHIVIDDEHPSGTALITVDAKGENCIVVAPGANGALLPEDLNKIKSVIQQAKLLLLQLEIPVETVEYAVSLAAEKGVPVVLNPAPARRLSDDLLATLSIITPNEKEAELLTGIKVVDRTSAEAAAELLMAKGVQTVIITMGAKGALLCHDNEFTMVAAPEVKPVDTTAAGDVFNGALATALAEGASIKKAVAFACEAASISVTRLGAQASAPYRSELVTENSSSLNNQV